MWNLELPDGAGKEISGLDKGAILVPVLSRPRTEIGSTQNPQGVDVEAGCAGSARRLDWRSILTGTWRLTPGSRTGKAEPARESEAQTTLQSMGHGFAPVSKDKCRRDPEAEKKLDADVAKG